VKKGWKLVAGSDGQKYFLVANAAIVGPLTIATAIIAAAFALSPAIPKTPIPQFAMPKARVFADAERVELLCAEVLN
jgi:hypothetical protein